MRAPADGYTLLFVASVNAINATLYDKLPFNFIRDISPVASIIREPSLCLVNPSVPVKSVPEFITYAKANPGKINMASSGNGSVQHVSGEFFKIMTGISLVHVPYRGAAPALTDSRVISSRLSENGACTGIENNSPSAGVAWLCRRCCASNTSTWW